LQIEAIKNVNSLIKKTQGVMASTKKSYEAAVQARNATGERHGSTVLLPGAPTRECFLMRRLVEP
jgi:hypothetical protein